MRYSETMESRLIVDGRESDDEDLSPAILSLDLTPRRESLAPVSRSPVRDALLLTSHSPVREASLMGMREAPDGEEGASPVLGRPLASPAMSPGPSSSHIRPQGLVRCFLFKKFLKSMYLQKIFFLTFDY